MARAGSCAYWEAVFDRYHAQFHWRLDPERWRKVVRAILKVRQEQAMKNLTGDLFDPERRAEWEKDLICPHCGKRVDEEGA